MTTLSEQQTARFSLAGIRVDTMALTLTAPDNATVSLQQKPIEVLQFLAQQYPRLVSRAELIDAIWAGNTYVGEKALTNAIWQLRHNMQLLSQPDMIVTVRKKGYRLAVAPEALSAEAGFEPVAVSAQLSPASAVGTKASGFNRFWLFAAAMLVVVVLWFALVNLPVQLTSQRDVVVSGGGRAMYPSLSADGRYLAFSWRKFEQSSDIYLMDLQKGPQSIRQLTFSPDNESMPQWGPDNRYLYFSIKTAIYGHCKIVRLDTVTLATDKIGRCNRHGTVYSDVSPDGRYFAYNGNVDANGSSVYMLDLQQLDAPATMLPCKQNCQYRVRDLAFSPDGRYIALTRRANRLFEEIYLYDIATAEETQLTQGEQDIIGLSWHPDSQHLLYGAFTHGKRRGFLMNVQTQQTTPLDVDGFGGPSRITDAGEVYYHDSSSAQQLAYIPLQDKVAGALFPLTASDVRFESPSYSAQAKAMAYISNESGYLEVWSADANMQQRKQLTHLNGVVKYPQWSHDGRHIVFIARPSGEGVDKLTVLELKTGKLQTLQTGAQSHGRPSWAFDDSAIIYSQDGELHRITLGDEQQQLTQDGGSFGRMFDNDVLYFTKGRNSGLWRLTLDGNEQQLLSGDVFSSSYAWAGDSKGIYFLQIKPEQVLISYLTFASMQLTDVVRLPGSQIHLYSMLNYDSEHQRLLLELAQYPRSDIIKLQHPLLQ